MEVRQTSGKYCTLSICRVALHGGNVLYDGDTRLRLLVFMNSNSEVARV